MNNYQLNNTSVYLGGQTKWDLVLDRDTTSLHISDFHLSPIADNVPHINVPSEYLLDTPHSENFKKFYNDIKGSFWTTNPDIPSREQWRFDQSYVRGCKRKSEYQLYKKQFEYLQPLWIEQLGDDLLSFRFDIYTVNDKGEWTRKLDSRTLTLEGDTGFDFHDSFIRYFNNWLRHLNLINGNNKCVNIDFQNRTAKIDGVNVLTGERSGEISCDDLIQNILLQERPLMETDYIITTLFMTHNAITSQLFNFNFCFDIEDILDPAITSLMGYSKLAVDCVVKLGDKELSRRSLFTNYEFVPRDNINNFLPTWAIQRNSATDVQELPVTWKNKDKPNGEGGYDDIETENVLDYLRDYNDAKLKTSNKITQPIIHWRYSNDPHERTFNAYKGYYSQFVCPDWVAATSTNPVASVYHSQYSNGNTVNYSIPTYDPTNNTIGWIAPGRFIQTSSAIQINELSRYIDAYVEKFGVTISDIAGYWGQVINEEDFDEQYRQYFDYKLLIMYVPTASNDVRKFSGNKSFLIVRNNLNSLTLMNLCNDSGISQSNPELTYIFTKILDIIKIGNDGYFLGFGTELGVGSNELGEQVYVKLDDHITHIQRKDGDLSPALTDNINKNYLYELSRDGSITQITTPPRPVEWTDEGKEYDPIFETKWPDGGWVEILADEIEFEEEKNLETETWTIKSKIIDKIKFIYGVTNELDISYIYSRYHYDVKFDYKSPDDIENVVYKIKMTLI